MRNIAGRAGCLFVLWLTCTFAQADSFTVAVTERDGTPLGSTGVAARTYPMNVTNSDSTYAGTHTLTASAGAQLCAKVANSCTGVSGCQASMDVTFSNGQADICLKMPPNVVGPLAIDVSEGSTSGTTTSLRTIPAYLELSVPSPSIVNRSELPASCVSTFTYTGEPLRVSFSLTARNDDGALMNLYDGSAFNAAIADTASWTNYGANSSMGLRFVGAGFADSRVSDISVASSSTPSWSGGTGSFQADVTLARKANNENPYIDIDVGIAPQDADGVGLKVFDLDADSNGVNERASVGKTTLRHGRLKIANAYGSDVLPLPVDVQAQYWNGSAFVNATDDNCTPLDGGYFTLAQVGALPQPAAGTTGVVGTGTLDAKGKGKIALTRLTAPITGKVITAIKTKADSDLVLPLKPPGLNTYLPGVGTGTFGVYRSGPVIFRRELHY